MSPYLDGDLASRARARLRRHVEECADCRDVLASLGSMLGLLQSISTAKVSETPDIASVVRRRLREAPEEAGGDA
jgi:anti-sigma factor RsiW